MNSFQSKIVTVNAIKIGNGNPFALIAGPCVVENKDITFQTAETLVSLSEQFRIPLIFKSSYKKANRTSGNSFTTLGEEQALAILSDVRKEFHVPILTDIHLPSEATMAAEVADVLQIPAFLCRQTELLEAAGKTGKVVNIKKGQFLAPSDMRYAAQKVAATGNDRILLTERGTTFGYHNLVVDMRSLPIMRSSGYPVVLDATHSVQIPSESQQSGGQPEFIFPIARAGAAVGIDALFIETHPNPAQALSDAASQLPLSQVRELLLQVQTIDRIVKNY
jgi:2-dehydro-3-deoxyphosphooctonate aldolase (KDO 8-P synthase)